MKKLFAILATAILTATAALTTGCSDSYDDGTGGALHNVSVPITILSEDWVRNDNSSFSETPYYSCRLEMPELTRNVINNGIFHTYFCWEYDNGKLGNVLVQEGLGYTYYHEAGGEIHSRTITCDYSIGEMMFYVRSSDPYATRPETMDFRFVAMW